MPGDALLRQGAWVEALAIYEEGWSGGRHLKTGPAVPFSKPTSNSDPSHDRNRPFGWWV